MEVGPPRLAHLVLLLILSLSCTRMPTAPPVPITVEGQIADPSGAPIRNAGLFFFSRDLASGGYFDGESARTDSTGRYTIDLMTGTYEVRIHPGIEELLPHWERVTFRRSSTRYDYRFGGYVVRGSVRGPDGAPLDSGFVRARLVSEAPHETAQTRFHGGEYSILLPSGTYSLAAGPSYPWSGLPWTEVRPVSVRSDTIVDIVLSGVVVDGTVLGPDGAPAEGAEVRAIGTMTFVHVLTGADGRYRLWVAPGTYEFEFHSEHSFIVPRVAGPIEVRAPLTLDRSLAGPAWTGTVRWRSSGEAVPGVFVGATVADLEDRQGAVTTTDPSGAFTFIMDPERTYNLQTYHPEALGVGLRGLAARTDTVFAILLDPLPPP